MDSENNFLLVVIVALLLLIYFVSNKRRLKRNMYRNQEHMIDSTNPIHQMGGGNTTYNPRLLQPHISEQIMDDNFIPLPNKVDYPWKDNRGSFGEADILDDGAFGNMGLSYNMCSKSCCSSQWPVPFSITPDDYVLMSNKEFVPSNLTCNNGFQDAGCLCLTKEQSSFLRHRGNNSHGGDL